MRDYVKAHPGAKSPEIAAALTKQGIKITVGHVANIKSKANAKRRARKAKARHAPAVTPTTVAVEAQPAAKPTDALTLQHVKAVAGTVKVLGGFDRLKELLEVIKEVGGLKKFRDLLEAMEVAKL